MVTFTEKVLNRKLQFLHTVGSEAGFKNWWFNEKQANKYKAVSSIFKMFEPLKLKEFIEGIPFTKVPMAKP